MCLNIFADPDYTQQSPQDAADDFQAWLDRQTADPDPTTDDPKDGEYGWMDYDSN